MERAPLNSDDDAVKQVTTKSESKYISRLGLIKHQQVEPRKRRGLTDRFWDTWSPELVAVVFSVACTVAIAIVLSRYDGKATPKIPGGITLNAVISILATSSKTALVFSLSNSLGQLKWVWLNSTSPRPLVDAEIFDDASRGPLGALVMLCSHAARSFASFGSLLIILALAFDPFVQQVVSYENRLSFTPSANASLPRARYIASSGHDFATTKALNAAFWQDNFTVMPLCPTSDCSWPVIQSISFAGECHADYTWTFDDTCTVNFTFGDFGKIEKNSYDPLYATRTCTATSGEGEQITTSLESEMEPGVYCENYDLNTSECGGIIVTIPRYIVTPLRNVFNEGCDFARSHTYYQPASQLEKPFFQYSVLEWKMNKDRTTLHTATRCTIDIRLDNMSSSIVGGELVANVTQTEVMDKTLQFLQGTPFMCFDSPYEEPQNFSALAQKVMEERNTTIDKLSFIYDPAGATASFCINHWQMCLNVGSFAESKWWTAALNSITTVQINATCGDQRGWNSSSDFVLSDSLIGLLSSPDNVHNATTNDQVWQELGPAKIVENLASSLTKLLRDARTNEYVYINQSDVSNDKMTYVGADTIPGSVGNVVPYVKIRWSWLVLPYALSIGGILFLLYTMYVSEQSQAPLWKSSINAFVFHGIDHDYDITSRLSTLSEMDRQAATTRVRLAPLSEMNNRLVLRTSIVRMRSNSA